MLTFVQKTPNSTTPQRQSSKATSITTPAFASSVTEGDLIVAYCSFFGPGGPNPTFTFSDSKGNTWYTDKYENYVGSESIGVAIGHCIVAPGKGGSGFTVTCTMSSSVYLTMGAIEVSGEDSGIGSGGSANNGDHYVSLYPSPGLLNVGEGNYLYVCAVAWYSMQGCTETSGWTEDHYHEGDGVYMTISGEHLIGSGDKTPTETLELGEDFWSAVGVAYKEAGGQYQEDLSSLGTSVSSIEDIQKFIQVLDSVIQSQSTLADLQNYLQILDSLIQSQSALADLQAYRETLESLIQSISSETDIKAFVEDLQSTINSISAVTAIQKYVHVLDSVAQSASALSDIQNYIDIVMSTAQSISSIDDFKTYVEILDSIATSVSTISDMITFAETLETQIKSEATLADIQHYFETLLTTIVSEDSVIDVLPGQYETTLPFYLESKKEFQFGKATGDFYMGKPVPQFIVGKRYGATA